jgi:uncharacterized protein (TIGR02677 family)
MPLVPAALPPASSSPPAARLLDRVHAFRYVTADNAPSYRALLEVFVEAKEHYLIELAPAEIRERLERSGLAHGLATPEELDRHLDQLADWGNVQRSHDTAAVARVEDFYRRRYRYRLTSVGEAAQRAVREVEATVGRSGSLQTSMLLEIDAALGALVAAARAGDAPGLVRALHRLRGAFDSLTEEANLFLGELDRYLSVERIDEERFLAHKHALLAYLGRFVDDLRRLRPAISERVAEAAALDASRFLRLAVAAAELPPALPGTDPAAAWVADQRERWDGVLSWFVATPLGPPRVERLHTVAVEAVVRLTRSLARLNERRARAADRAADFRTLARWFAAAPDDGAAHALWIAAFGLHPARHLHLADEDPERTRPEVSWWDAPPVDVPVRLRTRGAAWRAGRPPPVLDFEAGRTWMSVRRRRERAQIEAALARFSGRGSLHLSEVAALSAEELDQLLALLDEALSARRRTDGTRRARTADGRLEVVLRMPAEDRPWVLLETPSGRLRCRDYQLEVAPAAGDAEVREEEVGS